MENIFKEISPSEIKGNAFSLVGKDWMLITAGTLSSYNTMTASWGGFGVLWAKDVCFCVIRPQRNTYQFVEKMENFTLSFFDEKYRDALNYCGSKSGRDVDKAKETGITPVEGANKTVYFDEAKLVLECKKIYFQDIDPSQFLDPEIDKFYPKKDYHRMYVGEVIKCHSKK